MTESVGKIRDVACVTGDGTGSARKRDRCGRKGRRDSRDCVEISDEARRRSEAEENDTVEID